MRINGKKDFICFFFQSVSEKKYMYDAITNRIFQVSDLFYKNQGILFASIQNKLNLLKLYKCNEFDKIKKEYSMLKYSIQKQSISPNRILEVDYPFNIHHIENLLDNSLRHLSLCITEQCNLRCEYCTYSGHYLYSRKHSNNTMSYEIAKRSIDFFYKHSQNCPKVIISFYGGEPFLEFEKIKLLVEYSERVFNGKLQHYQITTNGTLLNNDEIIEWFLSKPNVYINITLNGNKAYHDAYRHYTDGTGSHNLIMSAISKIIKKNLNAYSERINFLCNYLSVNDIASIIKFYDSNDKLLGKTPILLSGVNKNDNDGFINKMVENNFHPRNESSRKNVYQSLAQKYIDGSGFNQPILKLLFDKSLYNIHKRKIYTIHEKAYFTGVCPPFVNRLYVNSDGTFNLCEKVSDFNNFGNADDGFDLKKIQFMLHEYKKINEKHCKCCWAIRFCSACYKDTYATDNVNEVRRSNQCNAIRENVKSTLELYCSIIENFPKGLEFLEEYKFPF